MKSRSSPRPRKSDWKVWQWALTVPGRSALPASITSLGQWRCTCSTAATRPPSTTTPRPDLLLESHRAGPVERHAEQGLLGAHLHLAHRHRHDELKVRPHRGAGVEVGGERHAHAGLEELPGGRVREPEEEGGSGEERGG